MLAARSFETYGPSHLTVLGIFAVGVVLVVLAGRRLGGTDADQPLRRTFAVGIVAIALPLQILQFTPDEWDLQTSLPFQLCDLGWLFAVHALWTRNRLSSTITYLWGITLTTQGIFTPDLQSEFPELRFLMFWACTCWSSGPPSWSSRGSGSCRPGTRTGRPSRSRWSGPSVPTSSTSSPTRTTATSTGCPRAIAAGLPRPMAAVRHPRDHDRRRGVGPADLALGSGAHGGDGRSVADPVETPARHPRR